MARLARAAPIRVLWLLAPLAAAVLVACGSDEEGGVPDACTAPPQEVRDALASAPEPVTLDGTPISGCFAQVSDNADIQALGFTFTEVASELSAVARARPESKAALELGYLVSAVREGASETPGIYDELVRRLEQELHGVDTRSQAFTAGERAGKDSG